MKRRCGHAEQGNTLVAVLLAGLLIMALGLGMLSETTVDLSISRRAADWESAFYAAWAGVEHSLGLLNARFPDYVGLPKDELVLTVPETAIGNGTYEVTVTSLGANRFRAESVGQARGSRRRLVATFAFRNANAGYYHVWGAEEYKIGGNSIIVGDLYSANAVTLDGGTHVVRNADGVGGNVAARNRVTLDGTVVVDGDVTAQVVEIKSSTVKVKGTVTTGFGPDIAMPEITLDGIRAMKPEPVDPYNLTGPVDLDCTKTSGRPKPCDGGYYIHRGDLTVHGNFKGRTVIGVEGSTGGATRTVQIPEDLRKVRDASGNLVDPDALFAIVSDGDSNLTIKGGRTVEALLYTTDHRVDLPGNVTVIGSIIAHKVDNNGNLFFQLDPIFRDLMPGLPGVRLVVVEWHEE